MNVSTFYLVRKQTIICSFRGPNQIERYCTWSETGVSLCVENYRRKRLLQPSSAL